MLATEHVPLRWEARGSSLDQALLPPPDSHADDESWPKHPEMKLALVGGVLRFTNMKDWILVARAGGTTLIPREATLHPFTRPGMDAALDAGGRLHADYNDEWTNFVARVVVDGDWDDPSDVIPVWIVEGLKEPLDVKHYYFE